MLKFEPGKLYQFPEDKLTYPYKPSCSSKHPKFFILRSHIPFKNNKIITNIAYKDWKKLKPENNVLMFLNEFICLKGNKETITTPAWAPAAPEGLSNPYIQKLIWQDWNIFGKVKGGVFLCEDIQVWLSIYDMKELIKCDDEQR